MLIRIVRMTFQEGKTEDFLKVFNASKDKIRAFEGCQHLELWEDWHNPAICMTYSFWESETALNHYRNSELFKTTWAATKVLFAEPPTVFSSKRRV